MGEKKIIRPALRGEEAQLAEVKSRYVRALYRGFLSAEYLKNLDETYYLDQIVIWLGGQYTVDVLEVDGVIEAFVAYGEDPDDPTCGMIHEVGIMVSRSWKDKELLMQACLARMAECYAQVRVWTVRDNFRARYLFEQLGFRADGQQQTQLIDGNELRLIRLACQVEKK